MDRFSREIGISLLVGLLVAVIWAALGIVTTHSAWSWPDFFGRAVAVSAPVAAWKIIGIAKIIFILMAVAAVAVVIVALVLLAGSVVGF